MNKHNTYQFCHGYAYRVVYTVGTVGLNSHVQFPAKSI